MSNYTDMMDCIFKAEAARKDVHDDPGQIELIRRAKDDLDKYVSELRSERSKLSKEISGLEEEIEMISEGGALCPTTRLESQVGDLTKEKKIVAIKISAARSCRGDLDSKLRTLSFASRARGNYKPGPAIAFPSEEEKKGLKAYNRLISLVIYKGDIVGRISNADWESYI